MCSSETYTPPIRHPQPNLEGQFSGSSCIPFLFEKRGYVLNAGITLMNQNSTFGRRFDVLKRSFWEVTMGPAPPNLYPRLTSTMAPAMCQQQRRIPASCHRFWALFFDFANQYYTYRQRPTASLRWFSRPLIRISLIVCDLLTLFDSYFCYSHHNTLQRKR